MDPPLASSEVRRVSADVFRPLKLRKAADEVVSVLIDAIQGGLLEPGDRLPREADLAARLEVSRNTVSDALARLERAGIVSVRRGSRGGAVVASRSIPPDLLLGAQEEHPQILDAFVVRRALETQATLLAAERATPADLAELRRLVEMLPDLVHDPNEYIAVDFRFHTELGRISGNAILADFLNDIFRRLLVIRAHYPVGHIDLERGYRNQLRSLAALASRDEDEILAALDDHLGSVEEHFLGFRLPCWKPVSSEGRRWVSDEGEAARDVGGPSSAIGR